MTTQRIYNRDVCLILAGSFFYMASSMLVTPLITGFAGSLGAGSALMGLVGGMSNFCSLICRPTAGNLADRLSKRRLSTVGLLLMLAGYLGYVAAHNNGVVVLSRVAQGVGFACCSVCMSTWMSDLLPRDRIGSGMGMYGTMNALSMAVGPAVGVQCWQRLGYHVSFAVSALFAVGALVTVRLVRDRGTLYPAMEVRAGEMTLSPGQLYAGVQVTQDPLGERYIIERIIRLQGAVAGLNRSADPADQAKADRLREIITTLLKTREEWRHAQCR